MTDASDEAELTAILREQDQLWGSLEDAPQDLPARFESSVGETLRRIREDAGWSQQFAVEQLAKRWRTDMHQTTLAKLEAGRRPIRLAELFMLASIYGLSVMSVLEMRMDVGAQLDDSALDRRQMELTHAIEEERQRTMRFLDEVVNHLATQKSTVKALQDLVEVRARARARAQRDEATHG